MRIDLTEHPLVWYKIKNDYGIVQHLYRTQTGAFAIIAESRGRFIVQVKTNTKKLRTRGVKHPTLDGAKNEVIMLLIKEGFLDVGR